MGIVYFLVNCEAIVDFYDLILQNKYRHYRFTWLQPYPDRITLNLVGNNSEL